LVEVGHIRGGERVLDFGAGTGRFAALLSATNPVVALDPSREMLEVARAKAAFSCVQADGHRLPFHAGAFDIAVVVMVLHHLADPARALADVARVSRRVVIATTDMASRGLGILEEAFPSLLEIDRNRFPGIDTVAAALLSVGFREIHVEERPFHRTFTTVQQLDRVRRKYLSTFDLLPPGEYERGIRFLETELPRRYGDRFETKASFTFLAATR